MKAVTKENFKSVVLENSKISIVQFITEWSGVWQIMEPVCNELSKTYKSKISFFTVDVEGEKKLGHEYGVREIPTILIFKSGKIVDHSIGLTSKNELLSKIKFALNGTAHEDATE